MKNKDPEYDTITPSDFDVVWPESYDGQLSDVEARILECGVLCVDLDGTLTYSDTFADGLFLHATSGFGAMRQSIVALSRSRSHAKADIALARPLIPATMPFDQALLVWLHHWKAEGVRLVLATAADMCVAKATADYLNIFDEVFASTPGSNLKGLAKRDVLVGRFGEKGFVYIGDSAADLAVWPAAAAAVAVHARPGVVAALRAGNVEWVSLAAAERFASGRALLKAIRPHQWSKNLLVFVPILTAGDYGNVAVWLLALAAFVAFSASASAIYLINDAVDLTSDRRHPRKHRRPFASGKLPIGYVFVAIPLIVIGATTAWAAGIFALVILYVALTSYYSLVGKKKVILDVMILSMLYSVRLFAGGMATGHVVSAWLLAFSGFLFFNLAVVKRYAELYSVPAEQLSGRGYVKSDLPFLLATGVASGFSASVVMALYIENSLGAGQFTSPGVLWGLPPLILGWQLRLWHETLQGRMTDDPIIYAARDRVTHWIVLAALACLLASQFGLL